MRDKIRVRFRVDGVLHNVLTLPKGQEGPLSSRVKIMANLNIAEQRLPQDGQSRAKIGDELMDIRISVIPTAGGERIVLRLLDKGRGNLGLEDAGFGPENLKVFRQLITLPHGILLLTGPTGSGKTTTLYSALQDIKSVHKNLVTVEDPIEYHIEGVNQVHANHKVGMTFARALRSTLLDVASGKTRIVSKDYGTLRGLAWRGQEIWFTAGTHILNRALYAVDLSGKERGVFTQAGGLHLHDVAPDGRVLMSREEMRGGLLSLADGQVQPLDLSWRTWSYLLDTSGDGKTLLFEEEEGDPGGYDLFLRPSSGGHATPLGKSAGYGALSPASRARSRPAFSRRKRSRRSVSPRRRGSSGTARS